MTVICNFYYEFTGEYCDYLAEYFYKSPIGYQLLGLVDLGGKTMLAARCEEHRDCLIPPLHLEISEEEYVILLVMEE
jgi:hypothetical protein